MFRSRYMPIAALVLSAALLLTACGGQTPDVTQAPATAAPSPSPSPPQEPLPSPEEPQFADWPPEETVPPTPTPEPDPVVAAQETPVGDEYFDDAAFIGNSLVDGFRLFSGLTNCDVYAATSMTIVGIGDYITQMSTLDYGKIYMLLGINEIGFEPDYFKGLYADAIDRLKTNHPDALLYIMGISPVSQAKDSSGEMFTMENIRIFNEKLLELCEEKGCYYIDLCDALAGEDGFLPANQTSDGVHFSAGLYKQWLEYLKTHYIPEAPPPSPTPYMTLPPTHETPTPVTPPATEATAAPVAPEA